MFKIIQNKITKIIPIIMISIIVNLLFIQRVTAQNADQPEILKVKIERITNKPCAEELSDFQEKCQIIKVKALTGKIKGKTFSIDFSITGSIAQISNDNYQVGQTYFAEYNIKNDGSGFITLLEIDRLPAIYFLIAMFCFCVILFGKKQGFYAILGMAISFLILIFIVAKGIFSGYNIILLTLISAILIMIATLYLTYGLTKKTHAAMLGSLFSLIVTIILSYIFIKLTELTGFASEESSFLAIYDNSIDMKNILFAGMIIGTLGLLDDITVGQASIAFQIAETNPMLNTYEIYKKGLEVGKDHVASMVNTLIIAYAGASFPLFLLFVQDGSDLSYIINSEIVAEEIVRMLAGSMGLLMAVPLTTYIASKMAHKKYN